MPKLSLNPKGVIDLYNKNGKSLKKEIEENTRKWKNPLMLMVR